MAFTCASLSLYPVYAPAILAFFFNYPIIPLLIINKKIMKSITALAIATPINPQAAVLRCSACCCIVVVAVVDVSVVLVVVLVVVLIVEVIVEALINLPMLIILLVFAI